MESIPLKSLGYYKVKINIDSNKKEINQPLLKKGDLIQFTKTISNVYDMIEILHFINLETKQIVIWEIRIEELCNNWEKYLEWIPNQNIKSVL